MQSNDEKMFYGEHGPAIMRGAANNLNQVQVVAMSLHEQVDEAERLVQQIEKHATVLECLIAGLSSDGEAAPPVGSANAKPVPDPDQYPGHLHRLRARLQRIEHASMDLDRLLEQLHTLL